MKKVRINELKTLLPIVLLVIIFIAISFYIPEEPVEKFVVKAGVFAPAAIIFAMLATQVFAPLSGTPIISAGFYLFGKTVAIYSFISVVLAIIINFWISRLWGIKFVTKLVGKANMNKLDRFAREHGLVKLFVMRFFLHGFEDLISYAVGLTSMRFKPYFVISVLAVIPWSIFWYLFSDKLTTAEFIIAILGLSAVFIILYTIWEKYIHKHKY